MTITQTTYGPKRYLAIKKNIAISQVSDKAMYDEAGTKLGAYMAQYGITPTGGWTVMYFNWDMENGTSDIAIAFPVDGIESVEDPEFSIIELPAGSAVTETIVCPYKEVGEKLKDVHMALIKNMEENGLKQGGFPVMALEDYATNPETEPDQSKWITNVYYFHE